LTDAAPRAVLTNRGAARVRSGHPWIYRSDVTEAVGGPGDVVRVLDGRRRSLGRAFYNPRSEITLRVATRRDEPVDASSR
jgi:23S rRNA (cytosine1962-C5)-methyltransferase